MSTGTRTPDLARGEAISKIHWGADIDDVVEVLRTKYNIVGTEADALIEEAIAIRKAEVRKKALVSLVFALVGLVISLTYFGIQYFGGFIRIGFGLILMASLGLTSLTVASRSAVRAFTGESSGPV